ncbi:hypothetical protein Gocc_1699 [Gaiella occulta]|uniref:Uncharacterized protein n=1 Tax=Gaiella occulta TaxID=1002870 RepID=A0A7M2YYI7_9ACTN|nr:hypothetical protein [Gaiella occulta]RDI74810.1 hypothetical protein Gocc_1699 [Gaiella occulta]
MEFAPRIDRRLVTAVTRAGDLHSSAAVWRKLRRRAVRLRVATPCYESVRRLVVAERERRAELAATLLTILEIGARRIPALPEHVSRIHRRHLALARSGARTLSPARAP